MKAVVDIGTNSMLLLVAERDAAGRVIVQRDESRITRLGGGVAASGRFEPAAVERTLEVFAEYRDIARQYDAELLPVATEGMRLAADREDFTRRAAEVFGREIRILSGDEEAELSYRSVADEEEPGPLRVLDIGGGSTELVVGEGRSVHDRKSHPIGSVRLTERFIDTDPPTNGALERMTDVVRDAFANQPVTPHPVLHGLAGTVTSAGAILAGVDRYDRLRVDGTRFSRAQVEALRDRMAAMTIAQRTEIAVLGTGRADVFVAGVVILVEALRHCGADTLVVRDRGLRYALV